jgi:hypothetical protein
MKEIPLRSADVEEREEPAGRPASQWAAQDDFKILSMAFTIKSMDARFAEVLRWHLEPFFLRHPAPGGLPAELLTEEVTGQPGYTFRFATEERFRVNLLAEASHRAVWEIQRSVPDFVRDFILLHAGAVVRDGGAVLIPAKTSSGKSSLSLGLLEAGWSYLSDDIGALDPVTMRVYPVPKRIKLIPDALASFSGLEERMVDRELPFSQWERFVRPEDVGAPVAQPTAVRWIVFPSEDFAGPARLEPVSKAGSVEAMAANCFNLYRYGERGVVLLSRIARDADAFRLTGGSISERVGLLCDHIASGTCV